MAVLARIPSCSTARIGRLPLPSMETHHHEAQLNPPAGSERLCR